MSYTIETTIKGVVLRFKTSSDVFSPASIDRGTQAMLSIVNFSDDDKVLDLGCGYGVVGILAAKLISPQKVIMTDKDSAAIELSSENALLNHVEGVQICKSDGFRDLTVTDFTMILSNPPYHTDFSVARKFIEKGFNRLVLGGRIYMVTKRKTWYQKKLISVFGGVSVQEIDGYHVFFAEKRSNTYADRRA